MSFDLPVAPPQSKPSLLVLVIRATRTTPVIYAPDMTAIAYPKTALLPSGTAALRKCSDRPITDERSMRAVVATAVKKKLVVVPRHGQRKKKRLIV